LEELAKTNELRVCFEGKKHQKELVDYYLSSKVFVSLNPLEPFGIVFLEALMAGCNIVAPYTGGHLDIAINFPNSFFLVDPYNPVSIANGIKQAIKSPTIDHRELIQKQYTFKRVAQDILNVIG
jgi:glycosyltransferase involved in cell wall biosynthesis